MSFGKRRPVSAAAAPSPRTNAQQPTLDEAPPGNSAFGSVLKTAGCFLAGIIIVAIGCEFVIRIDQAASTQPNDPFAKVGTLPPRMALLKTSMAEGWRVKNCTMLRPVEVMDSYQDNRFGRRDRFGSDMATQFADQAHFLQCIAETPSRVLCDSDVRKAFAHDVQAFVSDYNTLTPRMGSFATGNGDFEKTYSKVVKSLTEAHPELGEEIRAPHNTIVEAYGRVLGAVKTAAAGGMIAKSDLSYWGPREIKVVIGQTPVKEAVCLGASAP